MPEDFYRIKRLPPYVFSEVNALKAQARAAGRDVIDLGMGNPDGPTPPHIVAKLVEAVQNPKTHGYSSSRGIPGLRRAYAAYYARRFNVELDPEREIIVTLGSKEGFANLAQAITAPGEIRSGGPSRHAHSIARPARPPATCPLPVPPPRQRRTARTGPPASPNTRPPSRSHGGARADPKSRYPRPAKPKSSSITDNA